MFDWIVDDFTALTAAHTGLALAVLFMAAAGEALFVVGMFVPGMVILLGAGTLVGAGKLPFAEVLAVAAAGAFAGDFASYWLGRRHRDFVRTVRPFAGYPALLAAGEALFARYGSASLFLCHFVPGVKTVVPALAGVTRMGVVRFATVAALSSAAWAAAVLLPAVGVGMGVTRVGAADPRLLALVLVLLVLAWVAYRLAKFAAGTLWPAAVGRARRLADAADRRRLPGAAVLSAIVYDRNRIVTRIVWVAAIGFAVAGFVDLTLDLTLGDTLAISDRAISNFVQSFRTGSADRLIVALTMAGDGVVLAAVSLAAVGALLVHRDLRVAAAVAVAFGCAALFVPFLKGLLQRSRPLQLYEGADAFSFPSGHASMSMTVLGVLAVLLAHRLRRRHRLTIYAAAVSAAVLVGFSRIYLAAHWPSDVAAGLLFGAAVASAFALSLHGRTLGASTGALAVAVVTAFAAAYAVNLGSSHAAWVQEYRAELRPDPIARDRWLDGGWATLPARRIEFDGETGEPFVLQTDLPPERIAAALSSAGWTVESVPEVVLLSVLPRRSGLDGWPPLPLFHDGRAPVLAAVLPEADGERLVLRLWPSGVAVDGVRPVLLGSLTRERAEPVALGYAVLDEEDDALPPALAGAATDALAGDPGLDLRRPAERNLALVTDPS